MSPKSIFTATRVANEALDGLPQFRAQHVVPRGHEIEAILLAPLPAGYVGGEQFRHWLDPDATRVLRARFEQ